MIRFCTYLFLFLTILLFCQSLYSQAPNDHAEKAHPLKINDLPYPSDTRNCTLEEKCIDRKLTARCLVYHNDQWFTFTTGKDSVYYISIRNQHCEEVNGVQLQVIEGHLCKPSTYRILECVSLATQDDIYVTLRNLKPNHTYILNVDGYLHDLCKFEIGIATELPDFAVVPLSHLQEPDGIQKNGKVFLKWQLTEELQNKKTERFEIRRRFEREKKFYAIGVNHAERTVHGEFKREYEYLDTVGRKGFYYYQIIAITSEHDQYLVGGYTALSSPQTERKYEQTIELSCKDKTPVTLMVYNWENDRLLGKMQTIYYSQNYKIDFESYFQPEILRLKIIFLLPDGQKIKELLLDRTY